MLAILGIIPTLNLVYVKGAGGESWLQRRISGNRRIFIPRTNVLTDIAAVEPFPDRFMELPGNFIAMFDGQIRDATPSVYLVRRGDGAGRTRVDTAATGAAAVDRGIIKREIQRGNDFAKQEPRPDVFIDHAGILSEPSDAGAAG